MFQDITIQVPTLFGGISTQPPHVRFPNQVQDAINADFTVMDGISKRPGTWMVTNVDDLDSQDADDAVYRMHPIYRDDAEQYLVVYGRVGSSMVVRVFETSGREATVNITADAQTVLDLNSAEADAFRLVTIADYTLIANTTAVLQTTTSDNYTLQQSHKDYDAMIASTPAADTYHRTLADTTEQPEGYFQYDPGDGTFATMKCYTNSGDAFGTPGGTYNDPGANPGGFKVAFRRVAMVIASGTWTFGTLTLTKTGAFASYTFRSGDQIYITGGTGHTAGWYTIASKTSADAIVLEANAGLAGADNANTTTNGIGREYEVIVDLETLALTDMVEVANQFQSALQSAGATDGLISWTASGTRGGYFTITSPYKGTGSTVYPCTAPSGGYYNYAADNRPFSGTGGDYTITAGTGTPATDTLSVFERWSRVPAPAQEQAKLDPLRMPVQMVRTTAPSSGSQAVFDIATVAWTQRGSGDKDSNPAPQPWLDGLTLADIGFHRGRLVFAAGEWIVMSQVDDLFNFFNSNASNLVDSDPITRQLASDRITTITFIQPFRKSLLIFTQSGRQFELNAPEGLTNTTAAFTPSTQYQMLEVRPKALGNSVLFLAERKGYAGAFEYFYDDTQVGNTAQEVTMHCDRLLPNTITTIETSTNDGFAVVLPTGGNRLYCYRTRTVDGRVAQRAWFKWDFGEDYVIADIVSLKSDFYMLVENPHGYNIERFGVRPLDVGSDPAPPEPGTVTGPPPPPPPPAPGAFSLTSPANGATGVSLSPTLDWGDSSNASSYTILMAQNSGMSGTPIINTSDVVPSTLAIPAGILRYATTYYWRVTAINAAGSTIGTANPSSFTTLSDPSPPPPPPGGGSATTCLGCESVFPTECSNAYGPFASACDDCPATANGISLSGCCTAEPCGGTNSYELQFVDINNSGNAETGFLYCCYDGAIAVTEPDA